MKVIRTLLPKDKLDIYIRTPLPNYKLVDIYPKIPGRISITDLLEELELVTLITPEQAIGDRVFGLLYK